MATWLLLLPPVLLLVFDRPEALRLRPDGSTGDAATTSPATKHDGAVIGLSLPEARRTGAFWIIIASNCSFSALVTAMFFHQVSVFEAQGLDATTAASVFSVSAVVMVITTPLVGLLLDRFPTKPLYATALLSVSVSLVAMSFVNDLSSAIVFSVLFGAANGAMHAHFTFVWPKFFGRRHLGSIQGVNQMGAVIGASIGPIPLGLGYDHLGGYGGTLVRSGRDSGDVRRCGGLHARTAARRRRGLIGRAVRITGLRPRMCRSGGRGAGRPRLRVGRCRYGRGNLGNSGERAQHPGVRLRRRASGRCALQRHDGEPGPECIVIRTHQVLAIRQDDAVEPARFHGLPGPLDQLRIFSPGMAIDTAGQVAGEPELPALDRIAIRRAPLDRAPRGDRILLIEDCRIGIEGDHRVGEQTDIEPRATVGHGKLAALRQNVLVVPDAPHPAGDAL